MPKTKKDVKMALEKLIFPVLVLPKFISLNPLFDEQVLSFSSYTNSILTNKI